MTKLSKKKVIEALKGTGGVISVVAKRCGAERGTVYKYLERHPELKEYVDQERDKILDLAESKLFNQINSENFNAIRFFLSTKGKDRGYIERQEIDAIVSPYEEERKKLRKIVEEMKHENTRFANRKNLIETAETIQE